MRNSVRLADLLDQLRELCIDLVLKQRSAGGRAAGADISLVEHHRIDTLVRQAKSHQRPGDASADNCDIAGLISFKCRITCHEPVFDKPVRVSRSKVHSISTGTSLFSRETGMTAAVPEYGGSICDHTCGNLHPLLPTLSKPFGTQNAFVTCDKCARDGLRSEYVTARAIWQATLKIKKQSLSIKLYSALEDRQIHFHMLHKRDRTRVQQQMVDSQTGRPVPSDEMIKAFEFEPGRYVKVTEEEIERSEPAASRDVNVSRFVPASAIDPFLLDRPYYVGPDTDSIPDYFALGKALENKQSAGLAQWVMRKHAYRGALVSNQGYLMLITLRSASAVIPLDQLDAPGGPASLPRKRIWPAGCSTSLRASSTPVITTTNTSSASAS